MQLTKEQRFSIVSSLIFLIGFAGLLLIFGFSSPFPPPEEEGILINFGDMETGSGQIEPRPAAQPEIIESVPKETTPPPKPVESQDNVEEVMNQDFEEAAALAEKKRIEKKKQEDLKKQKEAEEQERIRQEELERQRLEEAERQRKLEQQRLLQERAKSAFTGKNPAGDNTGEGDAGGQGNQGNPEGDINSKNRVGGTTGGNGISFSLSGRSSQSLPKPEYLSQSEGKVVVEVTVDQNGNVLKAKAGAKGTTTTDKLLHQAAEKAALKASFDVNKDAPPQQVGTITYHFVLQ
ncbi:MAG: energy transducer TonB [Salinivirgaceae bacterium]